MKSQWSLRSLALVPAQLLEGLLLPFFDDEEWMREKDGELQMA